MSSPQILCVYTATGRLVCWIIGYIIPFPPLSSSPLLSSLSSKQKEMMEEEERVQAIAAERRRKHAVDIRNQVRPEAGRDIHCTCESTCHSCWGQWRYEYNIVSTPPLSPPSIGERERGRNQGQEKEFL